MSSSVAYLIVGMYERYRAANEVNDAEFKKKMDLMEGQIGLMGCIHSVAVEAMNYLDANLDWDKNDGVFDYEYIDDTGKEPNSLDAALWQVVFFDKNIYVALNKWIDEQAPHLRPEPQKSSMRP